MFLGPYQSRATIDGATVRLQRVTQADAGEYRCEVSAPLDSIKLGETNVTLKVLGKIGWQISVLCTKKSYNVISNVCFVTVPPHTPSCDIPSSALTGSFVELRCKDQHSIPPASYTWYKDKMPLMSVRHTNANYTVDEISGVLVSVNTPSYLFGK